MSIRNKHFLIHVKYSTSYSNYYNISCHDFFNFKILLFYDGPKKEYTKVAIGGVLKVKHLDQMIFIHSLIIIKILNQDYRSEYSQKDI